MGDKDEEYETVEGWFRDQLGLELSEILTIQGGRYVLTRDSSLGLSMASLQLDLTPEEHGVMARFLENVGTDRWV